MREYQTMRTAHAAVALLLLVLVLASAGCAQKGEPIQRTPEDRCMVRACSVYY
jgi:hypothetical protein